MSPASYRAAPPRAVVLQPYHGGEWSFASAASGALVGALVAFLLGAAATGAVGLGLCLLGPLQRVLQVLLGPAVRLPVAVLEGLLALVERLLGFFQGLLDRRIAGRRRLVGALVAVVHRWLG